MAEGHSVWPMSERTSVAATSASADAVSDALLGFHQPHDESGLLPRHNGTWHDSLALTHCLCWGAAWRMLDYLADHPEVLGQVRAEREAAEVSTARRSHPT